MHALPHRDPVLGAALLARARNAIGARLGLREAAEPWHPALVDAGATFVTVTVDGELRGCIGRLVPARSLEDDVRANALAAAFDDRRFTPIGRDELPGLRIEVSVLGPATPLACPTEAAAIAQLRAGRDGVILDWRGHRATFLPQVWASLPTAGAFLGALKRKAGLPLDFWALDVQISRYEVIEYGEEGSDGGA